MTPAKLLLATGGVVFALALAWWWSTFGEVVRYGYLPWREAGRCLVNDSDLCALARTLCLGAHPKTLIVYPAGAFWLAVALLSISALTPWSGQAAR